MSWISNHFIEAGFGTQAGRVVLHTPEFNIEDLEIPDRAFPVREFTSMSPVSVGDMTRMMMMGGLSDNTMITEQRDCLRTFIAPPNRELAMTATPASHQIGIEVVGGSTGPTGQIRLWIRFRDRLRKRRSPFSGLVDITPNLSGTDAIRVTNMADVRPDPIDRGVDAVEFWIQRNGITDSAGHPDIRLLATRDIGAASYLITETVETESETEQGLQAPPRGRFGRIYHNCLYWAGNERYPTRIFKSPLNRYDEYGGFYRETRNGEAITGMSVIRDSLNFFGEESAYRLTGYTERDIKVDRLESNLGCLTHFGIKKVGTVDIVPGLQGFAVCDGSSMRLIDGDYQMYWAHRVRTNSPIKTNGFAVNDEIGKVYKFHEPGFLESGRQWVLDYGTVKGIDNGQVPLLSWDRQTLEPACGEMLAKPGGLQANFHSMMWNDNTGNSALVRENSWSDQDYNGTRRVILQTAMWAAELGAGPWDALKMHELWLFLSNMLGAPDGEMFNLRIQNGNEFAAFLGGLDGGDVIQAVFGLPNAESGKEMGDVPYTSIDTGYFPQALFFGNLNLQGEGFSVRMEAIDPTSFVYKGLGMMLGSGTKFAHKSASE